MGNFNNQTKIASVVPDRSRVKNQGEKKIKSTDLRQAIQISTKLDKSTKISRYTRGLIATRTPPPDYNDIKR